MRMKLKEICEHLNGDLSGDGEIEITGVSGIKEALPTQITFVANPKYLAAIATTQAGCYHYWARCQLATESRLSASIILTGLSLKFWKCSHGTKTITHFPGVDETAILGKNVKLGERVSIQAFTYIADNVEIGR